MNFNLFLLALFIFNTIQIYFSGLSFDESYYWIYSLTTKFGHFDHPPMVGWLIKLGTSIFGNNELGVRFIFNILQILTLKLMWEMTNKKNLAIFMMATLSMPLIASAGFLALPDTPLVFFAVLFLFYVKKYLYKDSWKNALIISFIISLLFYSKYHGIVVVLFTTIANPSFFKRKSFWGIIVLTILLYLPHIYWQYSHEFVTFKYHLFGRKEKHLSLYNIFDYVGGQLLLAGLLSSPYILKSALNNNKDIFNRILKFNVWGFFILLLLFSALSHKIQANWTITNSAILVILATNFIDFSKTKRFVVLATPVALLLFFMKFYVLYKPQDPIFKRAYVLYPWNSIVKEVDIVANGQKIVANRYQIAAKLSFYSKQMVPALHFGSRSSEFEFAQKDFYPEADEKFTFLSYSKFRDSVKIDIGYPGFIYATPNMTIEKVRKYLVK